MAFMYDAEERRVLYAVLDSFRQYRTAAHYNITHLRRQAFYSLPSDQIDLLSSPPFSLPATFNAVDDAIDSNADLAEDILRAALESLAIDPSDTSWHGAATPSDMDKAHSTLRQVYRDWSLDGQPEREAAYSHILTQLDTWLAPSTPSARPDHRVLVPGAGLGRLIFDVCVHGYSVEGNEISFHQLLASNYLLNYTQAPEQHKLFPWALSFSNHLTRADQLRSVLVPDIRPETELEAAVEQTGGVREEGNGMSMTAGDFCSVYRSEEYREVFSAVATCFFIDTAPNVIKYIDAVAHCLKPGGYWINIGPLLWHFESNPTPAEREEQRWSHSHTGLRHADTLPQTGNGHMRTQSENGYAESETENGYAKSESDNDESESDGENGESESDSEDEGIGEPGLFELSNDEVVALVEMKGFEIVDQKQAPNGETGYIQNRASMLQNVYSPASWVARKRG